MKIFLKNKKKLTKKTGEKIAMNEEETLLVIKRLHKVLRPFMLRRLKKDVESELPDKVERVIKCHLSAIQRKIYKQIKSKSITVANTSEDGTVKVQQKGLNNTIMQLRKICNHPYVFAEIEQQMNPRSVIDENFVRVSGKFEFLDVSLFFFFIKKIQRKKKELYLKKKNKKKKD